MPRGEQGSVLEVPLLVYLRLCVRAPRRTLAMRGPHWRALTQAVQAGQTGES